MKHDRELLAALRESRGFDTRLVCLAKVGRLTRFFREQGLDAAVVGVSGGVDSAVVLSLLEAVRRAGALRRVVALLLPIEGRGATGQEKATRRGRLIAQTLGAEIWEAPLNQAQAGIVGALARASGLEFTPWAAGQVLSVVRTPALYGAAALLQAHGFRSLVVGTTNRDEGAYLGFFGKASDGMVDLQPLSDLHKSEVRALAQHFGIPDEITHAAPAGDVHDGRVDEEMIGASYDAIELALRLRELGREGLMHDTAARDAIERQHSVNAHKYKVGSPAVHLDVLPRGVPGGWTDEVLSTRTETRPAAGILPGAWDPPKITLEPLGELPAVERLELPGFALVADQVLTSGDCQALIAAMHASGQEEPVGVTGLRGSMGAGSVRATTWSPELAQTLFARLAPVLPSVRFLDALSPTDGFATATRTGHQVWRLVGLSPILRFMRYEQGGRHLCHYDAGFDYGDGRRTLLSVVFYLTLAEGSGATRFVRDGQDLLPTSHRDFSDWSRDTLENEVITRVEARPGRALVFDHRLCHDVERWEGKTSRVIIRADVVYEAIPEDAP